MKEPPDLPWQNIFIESIIYTVFCALFYPDIVLCAIASILLIIAFACHVLVYKIKIDKFKIDGDS